MARLCKFMAGMTGWQVGVVCGWDEWKASQYKFVAGMSGWQVGASLWLG